MDDFVVEHEGELVKSPPLERDTFGRLKRWHKRYCVLRRSKTESFFNYYEDWKTYNYGGKFKGSIKMQDCVSVTMQSTQFFKRDFIISLRSAESSKHKGRVFHFCASNQVEQKHWHTAMKQCILEQLLKDVTEGPAKETELQNVEPRCYKPNSPTPLELKTEIEKANIRRESKTEYFWGNDRVSSQALDERNKARKDEATQCIITSDSGCCCMTQAAKENKRMSNISNGSSGYGSIDPRSSSSSRRSSSSDILDAIHEPRKNSNDKQDLFDFTPAFVGPRTIKRRQPLVKAKSMGNLFENMNIATSIELDSAFDKEERMSLEQRVKMILRKSATERTAEQFVCRGERPLGSRPQSEPWPVYFKTEGNREAMPCRKSSSSLMSDGSLNFDEQFDEVFRSRSHTENKVTKKSSRSFSDLQHVRRPAGLVAVQRQFSNIDESDSDQCERKEDENNRRSTDPTGLVKKRYMNKFTASL